MKMYQLLTMPCLAFALSSPLCQSSIAAPAKDAQAVSYHASRLPASFFAGNRARLLAELKKMGPGTIAIIKSMPEQHRNGDSFHMYRQDSDFYYMTGIEEAESVAILDADSDKPYTLLVRARDVRRERYDGARLGVEGATRNGADTAESFPAAEATLKARIQKAQRVVLISNFDEEFRRKVLDLVYPFGSDNNHSNFKKTLVDGRHLIAEMRVIKQAAEIDMLQRAVEVTAAGHLAAMRASRSAQNEGEVAAAFQGTVRSLGARFTGYDTIAGAGGNSCTLHYVTNDAAIEKNRVMLLDAGAEVGYYTADVTRTWPVNGKFSKEQKTIYELVLKAQNAAIALVKEGKLHHEGFDAAMRIMSDGMVDLGILKGDKDALYKNGAYNRFTMHGISHWLGLDVHDAGDYFMEVGKRGGQRPLQAGMALTVEPGIYIPKDANDVDEKWRGIGVRIEDVVLVTKDGNRNMSEKLPRTVEAIEAALAK